MPSSPPSELRVDRRAEMKALAVATFGVFANTRTASASFCDTNQRESSPGACSIASGWLNVRFGNTRCNESIVPPPPVVFAGATHVRFDGRASSPTVGPGGGGGGVGVPPSSEDELWHASSSINDARTSEGRTRTVARSPYILVLRNVSQCSPRAGGAIQGKFCRISATQLKMTSRAIPTGERHERPQRQRFFRQPSRSRSSVAASSTP